MKNGSSLHEQQARPNWAGVFNICPVIVARDKPCDWYAVNEGRLATLTAELIDTFSRLGARTEGEGGCGDDSDG